jgi:threonine dehydratase/serine racemase
LAEQYAADLRAVREAATRLAGVAHRTPVATCATLDRLAGRRLFFKCEQLQKAGAFKFRGALNAVAKLGAGGARGVVTHSSGNHGQALALAARLRGIPAWVVVPEDVAAPKLRALQEYGGRAVLCEPSLEARDATARRVAAETGAVLIPPFDHPDVIAGQGTVALELLEQVPDLDAVVAPVGGGGLVSGIALVARELDPRVRILAAEPRAADDAARSKALGRMLPQQAPTPKTLADGLLTSLGALTWPVIRDCVERVVTVEEDEIVSALRLLWERAKLLVEPSAAVAFAAALSAEFRGLAGVERVGVVLSGGNVDLDRLPW